MELALALAFAPGHLRPCGAAALCVARQRQDIDDSAPDGGPLWWNGPHAARRMPEPRRNLTCARALVSILAWPWACGGRNGNCQPACRWWLLCHDDLVICPFQQPSTLVSRGLGLAVQLGVQLCGCKDFVPRPGQKSVAPCSSSATALAHPGPHGPLIACH